MRPWDGIISDEEQRAYGAAGFGRPSGIGTRPGQRIFKRWQHHRIGEIQQRRAGPPGFRVRLRLLERGAAVGGEKIPAECSAGAFRQALERRPVERSDGHALGDQLGFSLADQRAFVDSQHLNACHRQRQYEQIHQDQNRSQTNPARHDSGVGQPVADPMHGLNGVRSDLA